jgi:hypothetical protein
MSADVTKNGATNKGALSKMVKAWEAKNGQSVKRAAGLGLMAVSLAACGSDDDDVVDTVKDATFNAATTAYNTAAAAATTAATAAAAAQATADALEDAAGDLTAAEAYEDAASAALTAAEAAQTAAADAAVKAAALVSAAAATDSTTDDSVGTAATVATAAMTAAATNMVTAATAEVASAASAVDLFSTRAVDLTIGQDLIEAGTDTGEGDDTITGAMLQGNGGVTAQSFENADEIDGGDGDDTLTVTIDDDVAAMVSNVEAFIVRNVGAGSIVDMANFDDSLETITVRDSSVGTTINNIQSAASISLDNVTSTVTIDFDDDVLASDVAIGLLTVDGTTSTITVTVGGADVLTGAIIDVLSDSAITLTAGSDLQTLETVVITGAGDLSLIDDNAEFDAITEVDASDLAGGLTMVLTSTSAAVTFTGGSGDDDVTSSGFDDVISTGAGDDSVVVVAAGDVTVDAGAGDDTVRITVLGLDDGDTIDGGAGDNIIEVSAATLDELGTAFTDENVTNFTTVAIFAASAANLAQAFDANDVVTTISVDVDLTALDTLTIDNFSGGTLEINAAQADAITVLSVGTTDSVTVAIGHTNNGVTIDDVQLDGIETVTIEANASGATTVTTLDLTGTETLVISGDSNLDLDDAHVVDTTLETVDLSDMTGVLELDLDTDGLTVIVGDLGDGSTIELGAGDRNTIEFGAEISNDIEIDGFDAGSTLSDDVIDLSALGIDFADLDIADDGTDTTITSAAFDGSIVLLGVSDWTTLAEAQFVM